MKYMYTKVMQKIDNENRHTTLTSKLAFHFRPK